MDVWINISYRVRAQAFKKFFDENPDSLLRIIQVSCLYLLLTLFTVYLFTDNNVTFTKSHISCSQSISWFGTGAFTTGMYQFILQSNVPII